MKTYKIYIYRLLRESGKIFYYGYIRDQGGLATIVEVTADNGRAAKRLAMDVARKQDQQTIDKHKEFFQQAMDMFLDYQSRLAKNASSTSRYRNEMKCSLQGKISGIANIYTMALETMMDK